MFAGNRRWLSLFTQALGTTLLIAACGAPAPTAPQPAATTAPAAATGAQPAPTTAAAKAPVVLKMARNAEPGIFVPWLIDDNTALFTLANVYDGLVRVTKAAPISSPHWRPNGTRPRMG